ncbi:uncharacterized protein LOC116415805 [Nasonia vitripennis]|uniref:Uncharacterized protein n=1 Tax=Nasonia vitripennis TaxID=7425 RepID=A0A7M7PV49_NASVI|nr:uncharacterized protein LOC116415805 [Nasonia vitripennis]
MCDNRDAKGRFANTHPDKKYSRGRGQKRPRRFLGATCEDEPANRTRPSSSARKIQTPAAEGTSVVRNRLIDINILFPALEELLICKQCHGQVKLGESESQGLGFKIEVVCIECGQLAAIKACRKIGV